MKLIITKEEYSALVNDELRSEYEADGDSYKLKLEDDKGDIANLKKAKDAETIARKAAEAKLKEIEAKNAEAEAAVVAAKEEARLAKLRKDGDHEAIEKSWEAKVAAAVASNTKLQAEHAGAMQKHLVEAEANRMAASISTTPELLAPLIAKSLQAEQHGEGEDATYILRVLDSEGKPSADKVEDLQAKLIADPQYKGIIKASEASGGGATTPKGGSESTLPDIKKLDIAAGNPKEVAAALKARREAS